MQRIVNWSDKAKLDFNTTLDYLLENAGYETAMLVKGRVDIATDKLGEMPIGKVGRVSNTYEKVILKTSLIVSYELTNEKTLTILRLIHGARDWKDESYPE